MGKNVGVFFGCNHGGYFAKFRIDINTRFISLNNNNNYYFLSLIDKKRTKKLFNNVESFKDFIEISDYMTCNSWK
ncbi:hypothetical protein K9M42_02620 [Patescibacteria group bacterium]|nr:hypothetical protein [Patescibacteria group bacterium]